VTGSDAHTDVRSLCLYCSLPEMYIHQIFILVQMQSLEDCTIYLRMPLVEAARLELGTTGSKSVLNTSKQVGTISRGRRAAGASSFLNFSSELCHLYHYYQQERTSRTLS